MIFGSESECGCVLSEEKTLEIFTPVWSYVNENEKKKSRIIKKFKILRNNKNGLEVQWTGRFPQNLALICLTVSEKAVFLHSAYLDEFLF